MINLKKQAWRTGALCLAGVVALSVTGVSVYAKTSEKKETEVKEQIRDAVDDIGNPKIPPQPPLMRPSM